MPAPALAPLWRAPYLLLALTALFWAGNAVVGRAATGSIGPFTLAFGRWALALLVVLGPAWRPLARDLPVLRAHWRITLLLGVVGVGMFNLLLYWGLNYTTAINASLLQAVHAPLALLFAYLLLGDRTSPRQLLGTALAVAGAVTIVSGGSLRAVLGLDINAGDVAILLAVLLYTLYAVLLRRGPPVAPASFLAATFAIGALCAVPPFLAELLEGDAVARPVPALLAVLYAGTLPSAAAYLAFNRAVELVGPGRAAIFLNVLPVLGVGLAILFLGERLAAHHALGALLVGAGLLVAGRR